VFNGELNPERSVATSAKSWLFSLENKFPQSRFQSLKFHLLPYLCRPPKGDIKFRSRITTYGQIDLPGSGHGVAWIALHVH
jgi:hypothetical protein